ncbi:MAG TPA: aspartate aminotransferase family protein [Longimicrobiales bacterium]|nr:aspartate aminotransferase family protein [Longimicrobiales bacterium]
MTHAADFGAAPPRIRTPPPGPHSRALAERLARVESRNITRLLPEPPFFWTEARGVNVRDADDNVFLDLTAGFGVAAAGHARPEVARAIAEQAARLAHGLGDVFPPEPKVRLLERLAEICPGDLSVSILGSAGAEAVEAALKTALLTTGRAGLVAFHGSYHGLTMGALAVTGRREFREPFRPHLSRRVRFAPFPGVGDADPAASMRRALERVERHLERGRGGRDAVGAVLVEPMLGRGGLIEPPDGFLAALRALCDARGALLIFDEIYTGMGRTGRWFACEHAGVVPDLMAVGKGLTGSLPLSALVGTPAAMAGWPASTGEALHTSTFLGNPVACAAALAQIGVIEREGLVGRAAWLGVRLRERLLGWRERYGTVREVRGRGLLQGVVLRSRPRGGERGELAAAVAGAALARGVLLLTEGPHGDVLALTPPLTIPEALLDLALDVVEQELAKRA